MVSLAQKESQIFKFDIQIPTEIQSNSLQLSLNENLEKLVPEALVDEAIKRRAFHIYPGIWQSQEIRN